MKISVSYFRQNVRKILTLLDNNKAITLTYRNVVKGRIVPKNISLKIKPATHPAFGLWSDRTVKELNLKIFKP